MKVIDKNIYILVVKLKHGYQYTYITVDEFKNKDIYFHRDILQNAFPNIENVNNMLLKSVQSNPKALYPSKTLEDIKEKIKKRDDIFGIILFSGKWEVVE